MMKFCWALPVVPESLETSVRQSLRAEHNRFDAVLVSALPKGLDQWILATQIAIETEHIRLLVAQNTNYAHPLAACRALHTLNLLTKGRVDLNIVTGSYMPELAKYGKPLEHAARYRRTNEFIEVLRLLRTGYADFQGEFYQLDRAELFPPQTERGMLRYFVAGSSPEAQNIASLHGDYYLMYANDMDTVKNSFQSVADQARQHDRNTDCGLFIDIIARRTEEEAWRAAESVISKYSLAHKRLNSLYIKQADSVGVRSHMKFQQRDSFLIQPHLWAGLSQVSDSVSLSIVGSYENVIETIKKYNEIGTQFFILSASPGEDEIERIGQYVLPYLR